MKRNNMVNVKPQTLFQRPLTTTQQVVSNYLLPTILTSLIYILNFAADSVLSYQHHKDENHLSASLTLFWMYVPVLGAFIFTVSDVTIWPKEEGYGLDNLRWFAIKVLQHLFFPIWAMYRFAEQLFWSIEALRCADEEVEDLLVRADRNSVFELYHFLQAYLQAAPQLLFQLHTIFRQTSNFNKATVDMQIFCIMMSLTKMAMTTMSYQRFKSQKMAGRQYPWTKKQPPSTETYTFMGSQTAVNESTPVDTRQSTSAHAQSLATTSKEKSTSAHEQSSDSDSENSEPEADRKYKEMKEFKERKDSGLSITSSLFEATTSREPEEAKTDFTLNTKLFIPSRVIDVHALTGDDAAGKLVSFFWWFCFILPRMLSLSAFAYFFPKEIWWVCGIHYFITFAFLMYDAHTSDIPYFRAVFILFTSYVYMFCLIEFKIKFKKVRFIYNGFFILVYLENAIMTVMWYYGEEIENGWWYKYVYYLIFISSVFSLMCVLFYNNVLKPKKVTVARIIDKNSKLL